MSLFNEAQFAYIFGVIMGCAVGYRLCQLKNKKRTQNE